MRVSRVSGTCGKPARLWNGCAAGTPALWMVRVYVSGWMLSRTGHGPNSSGKRSTSTPWKPETAKCRWTTSSSGWQSGGGMYVAASAGYYCRPRTAPRVSSSITSWCSTAAGTKWTRAKTPTRRAGSYYVAMTRARQTLALVHFQGSRRGDRRVRSDTVSEPAPPAYAEPLNPAPYRFPTKRRNSPSPTCCVHGESQRTQPPISETEFERGQPGIRRSTPRRTSCASRNSRTVNRRSARHED